jgi:hypothetical protein
MGSQGLEDFAETAVARTANSSGMLPPPLSYDISVASYYEPFRFRAILGRELRSWITLGFSILSRFAATVWAIDFPT